MTDLPAIRPGADIGTSLAAIARSAIADAAREADGQSEAELVHDVRKAMKRWRALLRLLDPFLGEEGVALRLQARDLARALATARDAQAALDALGDLGDDYAALSPRSLATVKARIDALRTSAEAATQTSGAHEKLRAALAQTADRVDHWPLAKVNFHDLALSLTEGYRRARTAIPDDWTHASDEALHHLRQRVVVHRYQMEIIEPLWPRYGRVWVGEAQRLRDRLGEHQDLTVLSRLTSKHQPLARWRSRLQPAIAARQKDLIEAAMRHSGRLFAEKPRAFRRRLEGLWEARAG